MLGAGVGERRLGPGMLGPRAQESTEPSPGPAFLQAGPFPAGWTLPRPKKAATVGEQLPFPEPVDALPQPRGSS